MHTRNQEFSVAGNLNYRVADFRLSVQSSCPKLLASTHAFLGAFRVERLDESGWSLLLDYQRPSSAPPTSMREIWSGTVPPGIQAVNYVGKDLRRLELVDRGYIDLDLRNRIARIAIDPLAKNVGCRYFLMALLCVGLARSGHCPIHAASLSVPGSDNNSRGLLIVAKSCVGKSTTSLALTSADWRLMGDDLSLLCRRNGKMAIWGFPRHCHVRRPTLALLPWLRDLPLRKSSLKDTFELSIESLGDRVAPPGTGPLEPAAILVLEPPNPNGHDCQPIDKATALAALSNENVQPIEGNSDIDAISAFASFAALVQQTPAYRMSVGPKLDDLAGYLDCKTGILS